MIAIPWTNVLSVYSNIDTSNFIVTNFKTKQQVGYQLEYRGTQEVQNLLIQVKVDSKAN